MKLVVSKSNLLRGVNIVSKAVPTRTTMAILECILIDASAGEIKLTANDSRGKKRGLENYHFPTLNKIIVSDKHSRC